MLASQTPKTSKNSQLSEVLLALALLTFGVRQFSWWGLSGVHGGMFGSIPVVGPIGACSVPSPLVTPKMFKPAKGALGDK